MIEVFVLFLPFIPLIAFGGFSLCMLLFTKGYQKPSKWEKLTLYFNTLLFPTKVDKKRKALLKKIHNLKKLYDFEVAEEVADQIKRYGCSNPYIEVSKPWITTSGPVQEKLSKLNELMKRVYENKEGFDLNYEFEFDRLSESIKGSIDISKSHRK